jgi:hypothetical protein
VIVRYAEIPRQRSARCVLPAGLFLAVWAWGCHAQLDAVGRPIYGPLCVGTPTPAARALTEQGVQRALIEAEAAAEAGASDAAERYNEILARVVPRLRQLPLRRPVTLELPGVEQCGSPAAALTRPAAPPAVGEARWRLGSYDLLDERVRAHVRGFTTLTLVHEMGHALVDQSFNLARLFGAVRGDTDATLALGALLEGDANLVALSYFNSLCDPEVALRVTPEMLERFFNVWWGYVPTDDAIARAPAEQRLALLKAVHGTQFVRSLTRRGGWSAVNAAYRVVPASTEEILHPEKYLTGADPPVEVQLPPLVEETFPWELTGEDTMGELRLRLALGAAAAAGWGGDTYRTYAGEDGAQARVWVTQWDGDQDAEEFLAALARSRNVPADPRGGRWVVDPGLDGVLDLRRERDRVVALDGFSEEQTDRIRSALAAVRLYTKPNPIDRMEAECVDGGTCGDLPERCGPGGVRLSVMAVGARDCRVFVDGVDRGFAPMLDAAVPAGNCRLEVRCGDGRVHDQVHPMRAGSTIVIRREDWD